ncbi:phosphotransferase enzyme family protein [Streptomyces hydrogenans]|uniref:phosphotransferase enzyme family protein n=1 Tax=Streptomyces hydrogenans TaxID=1873719 RepID=UPI0033ECA178
MTTSQATTTAASTPTATPTPTAGLTEAAARATLRAACAAAGLEPAGARLLRLGENAVFALAGRPVVVRVSRAAALPRARRELAVARWLERVGFPAVRALPDVPGPSLLDGRVVTFWRELPDHGGTAPFPALAEALRGLHELPAEDAPPLPALDPVAEVAGHLAQAGGAPVPEADLEFLRQRVTELREEAAALRPELPAGPVHGDAHKGNYLRAADGSAILIDLEHVAHGPREWDLATAFGIPCRGFGWLGEDDYRRAVRAVGFDVVAWPGFDVLLRLRLTAMTTALLRDTPHDPAARAEFARRVATLRGGTDASGWRRG